MSSLYVWKTFKKSLLKSEIGDEATPEQKNVCACVLLFSVHLYLSIGFQMSIHRLFLWPFVWLFSALRCCGELGAVNKPILLCCLKLWNMMGLSVTTQQVFHGQTPNFAIKLQQKYAFSWGRQYEYFPLCTRMCLLFELFMSLNIVHKYFVECRQSCYSSQMELL